MRAGILVLFLAVTAYANSLGNGFAYDDEGILTRNPAVTSGDWTGALEGPWWPGAAAGTGLYRPVTSASFAVEWRLFEGGPLGFHALNVATHAVVSLLVFALLLQLGSPIGALVGGALFAIHPVHTEAVANVVGRAELYAAAFYLAACVLYWRGRDWEGARRIVRLVALGALYFLAVASKEIGVTLPGALVLLELYAARLEMRGVAPLLRGMRREAATALVLIVALAAYLGARFMILGSVGGERIAPTFEVVGPGARVLTALALWFQYVRLLLFPVDLIADYDPAVFFPSEGLDLGVVLGVASLGALAITAIKSWRPAPLVTLGILFFAIAVLPVSNLLFSTGTVLAERTLYLPSVGLSLVVAGLVGPVLALRPAARRALIACAALALVALFARTVARNPAWMSTFVVLQTLNDEHPESWRAFRSRAQGLARVGDMPRAAEAWDQAVLLAPADYTLLVEAADFHVRTGDAERGAAYLRRAVALAPNLVNAYQHLAAHLIRQGSGREGHRVALEGLIRAGNDAELWALVSESYITRGDLPAAIRAREAALVAGPSAAGWHRMGELLDAVGDSSRAGEARARAASVERTDTAGRAP